MRPDLPRGPRRARPSGLRSDGDLDGAIASLDAALVGDPQPEMARPRGPTCCALLAVPGDAEAVDDRATVGAVAPLAGGHVRVYDRGLALYLSDAGLDPTGGRLARAEAELAVRRTSTATTPMRGRCSPRARGRGRCPDGQRRSPGTRDALLWYHAGVDRAGAGETAAARATSATPWRSGARSTRSRRRAAAWLAWSR